MARHVKPDIPRGVIAEWTVTILLLLFGTATLVQAYVIPTGSMEDTLLIGDHLLVDKLAYAPSGPISKYILPYEDVRRGDIIVFRYPVDPKKDFIKRLVGLPGENVEIRDGKIYVGGQALEDPATFGKFYYYNHDPYGGPGEKIQVPEHSYFVLGDNSANSTDSRFWGFVPQKNVLGKAVFRWWPPKRVGTIG